MNLTKASLRKIFKKKRDLFFQRNQRFLDNSFYSSYSMRIFQIIDSELKSNTEIRPRLDRTQIGGYYTIKSEVNCISIIETLKTLRSDLSYSLPVVSDIEENRVLIFKEYLDEEKLDLGAYNIPIPCLESRKIHPDVLLVPLLCFDRNCNRLGYGKGFYDFTIKELRNKKPWLLTIGLAFDVQEAELVPTEKHDVQLDYVLTETRIFNQKICYIRFPISSS